MAAHDGARRAGRAGCADCRLRQRHRYPLGGGGHRSGACGQRSGGAYRALQRHGPVLPVPGDLAVCHPAGGPLGFPALIVYQSTSRRTGTCVASGSTGRIAETCAYPIRVLPPGGVLTRWNANSSPAWHMPEANTTVTGRRAVETRTADGWCAVLGATETITVVIPRSAPGHWYQMDACLRGPGLPQEEAQISSLLRSVRITKGG